jgi:hypothetical protein
MARELSDAALDEIAAVLVAEADRIAAENEEAA